MRGRRPLSARALIAGVGTTALLTIATLHAVEGGDSRSRALDFGFYFIDFRVANMEAQLDEMTRRLQCSPHYIMFYRDLPRPFWAEACNMIREHDAVPVVSLELWGWRERKADPLSEIASGKYDEHFHQWARDARAFGTPVMLRFGFEMNGDWFGWSGRPDLFIAAWRRVHDIFREEQATNVLWMFAPNCMSVPDTGENSIPKYWPGDEYVDWLAVDGYNFGEHHDQWHHWQPLGEILAPVLDLYAKERPNLPVLVSEFGCAPGDPGERAAWISDAARALADRPQVKGAIWFHFDKRREGEPNWTFWDDPDEVRAFREGFCRESGGN
ncbi:MAG: glycosyl hydrolase [Candidatus Eisenbacteria bacterium]